MLVYTTGCGVHATYDPSLACFLFVPERMRFPKRVKPTPLTHHIKFPNGVKKYIKILPEEDSSTSRPYTTLHWRLLAADFHRNLLKGGIYLYPQHRQPSAGKLRSLYECNPMAFPPRTGRRQSKRW